MCSLGIATSKLDAYFVVVTSAAKENQLARKLAFKFEAASRFCVHVGCHERWKGRIRISALGRSVKAMPATPRIGPLDAKTKHINKIGNQGT